MAGFTVKGMSAAPKPMKTSGGFAVQGISKHQQQQASAVDQASDLIEEVAELVERSEFQQRADREAERFQDATDSEFTLVPMVLLEADGITAEVPLYPALVFATRAAKDQFLQEFQKRFPGEILGDKYISGELIARALGFKIDTRVPSLQRLKQRQDKKLTALR